MEKKGEGDDDEKGQPSLGAVAPTARRVAAAADGAIEECASELHA